MAPAPIPRSLTTVGLQGGGKGVQGGETEGHSLSTFVVNKDINDQRTSYLSL